MAIKVGEEAPDFTAKDQNQQVFQLSSLKGKKNVVLAFFPFAFSPVCTNENACFTQDLSKYQSENTEVVGISVDSPWVLAEWAKQKGYKHRLLSDVKQEIARKYGVHREDLGCAERATVIVDKNGKVAFAKVQQDIKQARDFNEIHKILQGLR